MYWCIQRHQVTPQTAEENSENTCINNQLDQSFAGQQINKFMVSVPVNS